MRLLKMILWYPFLSHQCQLWFHFTAIAACLPLMIPIASNRIQIQVANIISLDKTHKIRFNIFV